MAKLERARFLSGDGTPITDYVDVLCNEDGTGSFPLPFWTGPNTFLRLPHVTLDIADGGERTVVIHQIRSNDGEPTTGFFLPGNN